MEYRMRLKYLMFLAVQLFIFSCDKDDDLSGLFYCADPSDERFEQSISWNKLNPDRNIFVESDNYCFLAAGDSHAGHTSNLDTLIKKASAPEISFLIHAGDLTTGRENDYDTVYRHLSTRSQIPFYLTAGNHDLFFNGWNFFTNYFGSSTYIFEVVSHSWKDLFICLDTSTGTLGPKQIEWLRETLKNIRNSYRNCVIFTHVNFFREHRTGSTNLLVEELCVLLNLFLDNRVDLVIMGHDHRHSVELLGYTHYVTLDALEDEFCYASYLSVTNNNGKLSYKFNNIY